MANSIEGLNTERESMIEDAIFPVMDAMMILEDATNGRGVTIGQINNVIREFDLDGGLKTGMGMVVEALDQMETEGDVICIETRVNPINNKHVIGRSDWKALSYRLDLSPMPRGHANPA
jgi:hypothetical protein